MCTGDRFPPQIDQEITKLHTLINHKLNKGKFNCQHSMIYVDASSYIC
jgi:hypothetical protein